MCVFNDILGWFILKFVWTDASDNDFSVCLYRKSTV